MFGPSVNAQVALCNNGHNRHAMGLEEVPVGAEYGGSGDAGGVHHFDVQLLAIVQIVFVSLEELSNDVSAKVTRTLQILKGGFS